MNKNIARGSWKAFIQEVKKHWSDASNEKIVQLQSFCEKHEKILRRKYKNQKQLIKSVKN